MSKAKIEKLRTRLEQLMQELSDHEEELRTIIDAKQEAHDNHSDRWLESEAADKSQEKIDYLMNAADYLSSGEVQEAFHQLDSYFSEE